MGEGEIVNLTSAVMSPGLFCCVRCRKHLQAYMEGSLAQQTCRGNQDLGDKSTPPLSTFCGLKTNDTFSCLSEYHRLKHKNKEFKFSHCGNQPDMTDFPLAVFGGLSMITANSPQVFFTFRTNSQIKKKKNILNYFTVVVNIRNFVSSLNSPCKIHK